MNTQLARRIRQMNWALDKLAKKHSWDRAPTTKTSSSTSQAYKKQLIIPSSQADAATSAGGKGQALVAVQCEILVDHLNHVVRFTYGGSQLCRKRVSWEHLQLLFESPAVDTFCNRPQGEESDEEEVDSDVEGAVDDMEALMQTSSLKPSVGEVQDLLSNWSPTLKK